MTIRTELDHRTPLDHLAEWRNLVDWQLAPVPEAAPQAALWVETVCDWLMSVVLFIDRMHWATDMLDPERWEREVWATLNARLSDRGLFAAGVELGVDLTAPGPLADGAREAVESASANRLYAPEMWENVLVAHVAWWREQLYRAAAEAVRGEGK